MYGERNQRSESNKMITMKNKLNLIMFLLFFYVGSNYSQFVIITDDLPSESYYNEHMGDNLFGYDAETNNAPGIGLRAGDPWRPDPEGGDESTGGERADIQGGMLLCLLFAYCYTASVIYKSRNKLSNTDRSNR